MVKCRMFLQDKAKSPPVMTIPKFVPNARNLARRTLLIEPDVGLLL